MAGGRITRCPFECSVMLYCMTTTRTTLSCDYSYSRSRCAKRKKRRTQKFICEIVFI